MGYTRGQIDQIYDMRMRSVYSRLAREDAEKLEAERIRAAEIQEKYAKASLTISALQIGKDIRDNIIMNRLAQTYGDKGWTDILGQRPNKFELRDPVEWGEFVPKKGDLLAPVKATGKTFRNIFDATVKTKGYEEFLAREEAKKELEKTKAPIEEGIVPIEEARVPTTEDTQLEALYKREGLIPSDQEFEEAQLEGRTRVATTKDTQLEERYKREGLIPSDQELQEIRDRQEEQITIPEAPPGLKAIPLTAEEVPVPETMIMSPKQQIANDMLERSGVILPEGMSQEMKNKILDSLDTVIKEGDAKDYKAFVDTLNSGIDNPDTFQSIANDLINNREETINAVIEGTYVPEVVDVSTVIETTGLGEIEEWETGMTTPIDVEIPEGTLGRGMPLDVQPPLSEAPTPDDPDWGTYASPGEIATEDKKLEALRGLQAEAPISKGKRLQRGKVLEELGITSPEGSPEFEEALKEMEGMFDEEGNVIPEKKGLFDVFKKKVGIAPDKVKADEMLASVGATDVGLELADTETADALSVGDVAGGVITAGTQIKGAYELGRVLTDEGATDVEKGLATTGGVKQIADPIFKKTTDKLVEEAVTQVTLELGKDAGTEAGKLAIKAAEKKAKEEALKSAGAKIASGAGAVLGGYQAYTGVKGAGEAWREGDIDEAILHGVGAFGGGLNMVGGGLIATGIGAPLGGILMGIGTVASLFSGVGLAVEGMVEAQNMPKQVFDTTSYQGRYGGRYDRERGQYRR